MIVTIAIIAAFQGYWLNKLYNDEWNGLKKRTDVLLKETVQQLQTARIRSSPFMLKPTSVSRIEVLHDNPPQLPFRKGVPGNRKPVEGKAMIFTRPGSIEGIAFPRTAVDSVRMPGGNRKVFFDSVMSAYKGKGFVRIIMTDTSKLKKEDRLPYEMGRARQELNGVEMVRVGVPKPRRQKVTMTGDTLISFNPKDPKSKSDSNHFYKRMVFEWSALTDSIPLKRVDSAYRIALKKEGIKLPWKLHLKKFDTNNKAIDSVPADKLVTSYALIGFDKPFGYQASFANPFAYILGKLTLPIVVAFALIAITVVSFFSMYRNLLFQRKLGAIKNEFISNITHELKTPIATVSVAIEALKNFNAIHDPARTKEYLDISASELQRLSLLVDKVLKLSMFENKEVELRKERFDMRTLVEEVTSTMRLQFEKAHAKIISTSEGETFIIVGDKMHITSVIYNLLDNALKYSPSNPVINISLRSVEGQLYFSVADNGIGIPADYHHKVFEKFFRVPTNDHHNIKGYGLGLSYVCQVVEKHDGKVEVQSEPGKGSTFTIKLPIQS
ncbi:MAG: two-component sensor histidine kinase [Chitinophagaceae bacterium]|nr:two-component sensor histidine kinase [Chitinophagaceae bacterium]